MIENLVETFNLEEATYIQPLQSIDGLGVTVGKIYDLKFGCVDESMKMDEYHIIDDSGRRNHAAMFFKCKLYKESNNCLCSWRKCNSY